MFRNQLQTTRSGAINFDLPPMRLFQKAKIYGIWDPAKLDFTRDAEDYKQLDELEKDVFHRLTALFIAGEESVTLDLLPLVHAMSRMGRLEDEIYLTSFLWEEAKHVEGFQRFIDAVLPGEVNLDRYYTDSYKELFYNELPNSMNRLLTDHSPVALANASVTYNMIVEGVLAETGYHAYYNVLEANNLMPGMLEFTGKLKQDESRHIAYGVYLLSSLVSEGGEEVWEAISNRMATMLELSINVIMEGLGSYEKLPFGLEMDMFIDYAMDQFQKRFARLEKAKNQSLEEIMALPEIS